MRLSARFISLVFHPLLLFFYLMVVGYWVSPYSFELSTKGVGLYFILSFLLLVFFPMLSSLLMRRLQITKSLETHDRQERIGPLIATLIFSIWYFINIKNDIAYPAHVMFLALGGVLSVSIAFFINNFTKISLHGVGAGAFLMAILILIWGYGQSDIRISSAENIYQFGAFFLLSVTLFISGCIGTSRLVLSSDSPKDLYGGYMAGVVAMLIAYRVSSLMAL